MIKISIDRQNFTGYFFYFSKLKGISHIRSLNFKDIQIFCKFFGFKSGKHVSFIKKPYNPYKWYHTVSIKCSNDHIDSCKPRYT